jgi:hypothetical protein
LLRQFEYQAGMAAADDGHRGIDVTWLRQELATPIDEPK